MQDETTPQDGKAMSPASTGSVGEPVAWAVTPNGRDEEINSEFIYKDVKTAIDVALDCDGVLLPLYRPPPPPTLTDAEREAVEAAIYLCGATAGLADEQANATAWAANAATLRGLLERTK